MSETERSRKRSTYGIDVEIDGDLGHDEKSVDRDRDTDETDRGVKINGCADANRYT